MNGLFQYSLQDLQTARDYLVELRDGDNRQQLETALRIVDWEIKHVTTRGESKSLQRQRRWTAKEDAFLRQRAGEPVQTKQVAKKILKDCASILACSEVEVFARLRVLGLASNLRAWGKRTRQAVVAPSESDIRRVA
jgi:hypothetical protein